MLRDYDGAVLYETEWSPLLLTIIRSNDMGLLRQYLEKHPRSLGPRDSNYYDPFCTAASCGSTDALRVMLEH